MPNNTNHKRKNLICWAVSDGRAGIEVQCTGLAEAMGFDPVIRHVTMKRPWKWFPPSLVPLASFVYENQFPPEEGWPDLVIACGRQAAVFNAVVRKRSRGKSFCIQVQDPKISPEHFDLVITPEHDLLRRPNVLTTTGGFNKVTSQRLKEETVKLESRITDIPKPLIAVLVGGKSKAYDLTESVVHKLGEQLQRLQKQTGCGFLITTSRRTGIKNEKLLRKHLAGLPAFIWDGTGHNPYFGFLGAAEAIIVTSDSVNMVTEAASTGKPVFTVDLEGGNKKFDRFHQQLEQKGITRPFSGVMENWSYPALNETNRMAQEVLNRMHSEGRI
ncbi:mitochondrial fission ELM1 family protein [Kiloniella sp.]|uniref:mitochondrial fission ELM1 family protein n=1 Tax=Kiloniella sp. TaxID=1938587 RepID=UPI003B01D542